MASHEGPLQQKSFQFAVDAVLSCKKIVDAHHEFVMTRQLIKSSSSIGANIEEAQHAESKNDFVSKLSISLKEAYESRFWIRLLQSTAYLADEKSALLLDQVNEIISMLVASIKTTKRNNS